MVIIVLKVQGCLAFLSRQILTFWVGKYLTTWKIFAQSQSSCFPFFRVIMLKDKPTNFGSSCIFTVQTLEWYLLISTLGKRVRGMSMFPKRNLSTISSKTAHSVPLNHLTICHQAVFSTDLIHRRHFEMSGSTVVFNNINDGCTPLRMVWYCKCWLKRKSYRDT